MKDVESPNETQEQGHKEASTSSKNEDDVYHLMDDDKNPPRSTNPAEATVTAVADEVTGIVHDLNDAVVGTAQKAFHDITPGIHTTVNPDTKKGASAVTATGATTAPNQSAGHGLSLFDEISFCFSGALATYGLSELRDISRRQPIPLWLPGDVSFEEFGQFPILESEIIEALYVNAKALRENKLFDTDLYMTAVEKFEDEKTVGAAKAVAAGGTGTVPDGKKDKRMHPRSSAIARRTSIFQVHETDANDKRDGPMVVAFADENSTTELVYGIFVNPRLKVILVSFRGSVTMRDWLVDADMRMLAVRNPLVDAASTSTSGTGNSRTIEQMKWVYIHAGFHEYLNAVKSATKKSKFDQIVEHLQSLLAEHPGFKVYTTGHSLGGALATLFAFQFGTLSDSVVNNKDPITCISFASPRVGNLGFAYAFQELEMRNRIRHLRIANSGDVITKIPDKFVCCMGICAHRRMYRHLGMELKLQPESHQFWFPHVYRSNLLLFCRFGDIITAIMRDVKKIIWTPLGLCFDDYTARHSCREYMDRLDNIAEELEGMRFTDLYVKYRKSLHRSKSTRECHSTAF